MEQILLVVIILIIIGIIYICFFENEPLANYNKLMKIDGKPIAYEECMARGYGFRDCTKYQKVPPHAPNIYSNSIVSKPYKCATPNQPFNMCLSGDLSKCMGCPRYRSYGQCIREGHKVPEKCAELLDKRKMMDYTPYSD